MTYTGQEAISRDIANLRAAIEAEGVKHSCLPVVAPASCFPTLVDEHYGSEAAALMGIAEALREEYRAIVDAGLQVQIDDAFIPFMYDVLVPPGTMEDCLPWAQPRIDAVNHAIKGIPAEMVRYHGTGPTRQLERPAHQRHPIVRCAAVGDAGQRRHLAVRGRQPAPRARVARVEDVELPGDKVIAPERIMASTDCGFAQGPYLRRVHPTIQWAKLEALSEGARIASARLAPSPA